MLLAITAAILLALPFALAWFFRRKTEHLKFADEAWGSVEMHANQLLQDKTLDPEIGDFVEFLVLNVGDGKLTRIGLSALLFRPKVKTNGKSFKDRMTDGQHYHFTRFVVDALLYDSLRTSFSGAILRRLVYWLVGTAQDEKIGISDIQIKPFTNAAARAYHQAAC